MTIVQQDVYIFDDSTWILLLINPLLMRIKQAVHQSGSLRNLCLEVNLVYSFYVERMAQIYLADKNKRLSIARALIRKTPILLLDRGSLIFG